MFDVNNAYICFGLDSQHKPEKNFETYSRYENLIREELWNALQEIERLRDENFILREEKSLD
jgi:hypothetical protein